MNSSVIETQAQVTPISHRYITKDGRQLQLRLMQAADADRLVEFFYRLSPESRWRRFHIATEQLDQATVAARAKNLAAVDNWQREGAVVALYCDPQSTVASAVAGEPTAQIVGVARLARASGNEAGAGAEIAVVVRDDFQQQGVGQVLLEQLVGLARRMEITHLHADVQADNAPALRVLKKLGLPITTQTRYAHTETTLLVK
jgi:GNAT superfamily N-acetyltransferase